MAEGPSPEVAEWLRRARQDHLSARLLVQHGGPSTVACFLCQQTVEKLLKACLATRGVDPPRLHDLEQLLERLEATGMRLQIDRDRLAELTLYAVAPRYPGFPDAQSDRDAAALLAFADDVMALVASCIEGGAAGP